MKREITVNACDVNIYPSSNSLVEISFEIYDSYISNLIGGIPEPLIMDCWDKKEIAQYLIDNGYKVEEL